MRAATQERRTTDTTGLVHDGLCRVLQLLTDHDTPASIRAALLTAEVRDLRRWARSACQLGRLATSALRRLLALPSFTASDLGSESPMCFEFVRIAADIDTALRCGEIPTYLPAEVC